MKRSIRKYLLTKGAGKLLIMTFLVITPGVIISGQEPPPRPITVTVTAQGLSFGTFTQGAAGGTVTVTATGTRTATGDVVLLSLTPLHSSAMYEVVGNPGTLVSLLNGADVFLPGSNGGSIQLTIGASEPVSPFVITTLPPIATLLYVGGTLTIGSPALNPPGSYSGTFDITFIQE